MGDHIFWDLFFEALQETLFLVFGTGLFVLVIGLIIGFFLYASEENSIMKNSLSTKVFHRVLATVNDVARSIPFIILLILLIPFTRSIMGTMLGAKAALPALIISASPFFARVVHMALKEVPRETLEAANSLGASTKTIVYIVFKEAMSSLVTGYTLTLVTLVGFMSAAAVIGAGGLAYLAYEYGKFGNNDQLMYLSIFTILFIVFIIQITGDFIARKINHN
ncbi:MAG: ABC transporter permease subunit [Tenericutes bacterium]|nr:ABC transporter permease subunit [Mycoplasmatota bacterium]